MASFEEHLEKARSNLKFLENVCKNEKQYWDWKVTVSFYSAVHLINGHIAAKTGEHYRSHEQVMAAINPFGTFALSKLDESRYLSYAKLRNLSRRSRYLVSDDEKCRENTKAFLTYDKHFARAVRHLDALISFINDEYNQHIRDIHVDCIELTQNELNNFHVASY